MEGRIWRENGRNDEKGTCDITSHHIHHITSPLYAKLLDLTVFLFTGKQRNWFEKEARREDQRHTETNRAITTVGIIIIATTYCADFVWLTTHSCFFWMCNLCLLINTLVFCCVVFYCSNCISKAVRCAIQGRSISRSCTGVSRSLWGETQLHFCFQQRGVARYLVSFKLAQNAKKAKRDLPFVTATLSKTTQQHGQPPFWVALQNLLIPRLALIERVHPSVNKLVSTPEKVHARSCVFTPIRTPIQRRLIVCRCATANLDYLWMRQCKEWRQKNTTGTFTFAVWYVSITFGVHYTLPFLCRELLYKGKQFFWSLAPSVPCTLDFC